MAETLVDRLATKAQKVIIGYRNESLEELRENFKNSYLHLKFPDTRGETELGIDLLIDECDFSALESGKTEGNLIIKGTTILDSQPILCSANVDLKSRTGTSTVEKNSDK
ncbi:MAG: hypothetical protein HON43_03595 [Alphaproteobacteria bacterium]|mgnify:CR=1 FL=1|nr:hypothetical protein [Alphaproteobacteria bacterium]MBT5389267.1 hypothetical protein [Alphaproteobacteria bacterium]